MDSRGFARGRAAAQERAAGWLGLGSLLCLGGAFVALVGRTRPTALLLSAVGVAALVGAVVAASRGARLRRYRPRRMAGIDWLLIGLVTVAPLGVAVLALLGEDSLTWATSPLAFPDFVPGVAVLIAVLGLPAVLPPARPSAEP
jgi:hypothetical protein